MRTLWLFSLLLASVAASAQDQDGSKFELFGGYSFEHVAICGKIAGGCGLESGDLANLPRNFNGWNAALTVFVTKDRGITADFSGVSVTDNANGVNGVALSEYTYRFGPTFLFHLGGSDKAVEFVHVLLGGVHRTLFASNGFSLAAGGGVDVRVSERWAIRAAQVDYVGSSLQRSSVGNGIGFTNGFRYSGGVAFRWSWTK
jgi:hypothetical protein